MRIQLFLITAILCSDIVFTKVSLKTPECQTCFSGDKKNKNAKLNLDPFPDAIDIKMNKIRGGFSDSTIAEAIQRWTTYIINGFNSIFNLKR